MAKVKTKKELERVYDVVRDILFSQPVGSEIEVIFIKENINIDYGERKNRRRVIIKGDKLYILSSYDKSPTKLAIDGTVVREDITTIPKRGFVTDIENILYYNQRIFDYKEYKDMDTDNIVFKIRKKA